MMDPLGALEYIPVFVLFLTDCKTRMLHLHPARTIRFTTGASNHHVTCELAKCSAKITQRPTKLPWPDANALMDFTGKMEFVYRRMNVQSTQVSTKERKYIKIFEYSRKNVLAILRLYKRLQKYLSKKVSILMVMGKAILLSALCKKFQ